MRVPSRLLPGHNNNGGGGEMEAKEDGESIGSVQLQSALEQLNHIQRLLNGDDGMSFSELLASTTSALGPSPLMPLGGLSRALPALLAPLLSEESFANGSVPQQPSLAKRAAFQPRRYLEITADLVNRTSDRLGQTFRAIELTQQLEKQMDKSSVKEVNWQKILEQRKAKRAILVQQEMQADQSTKMHQILTEQRKVQQQDLFSKDLTVPFQSEIYSQAKQMKPTIDVEQDGSLLRTFIQAWQTELATTDSEASNRIDVKLQSSNQSGHLKIFVLRIRISQTGFAWLWVHFIPGTKGSCCARVDKVNVLAESEVEETNVDGDYPMAAESSKFPLYRRITRILHTRLIQVKSLKTPLWTHLTLALFSVSTLCRLNEMPLSTDSVGNMPLRGQESILDALSHLDVSYPISAQKDHSSGDEDDRPTSPSPPTSALFDEATSE